MKLSAEEYRQRLAKYSNSTIELIIQANSGSAEMAKKETEITTNSELSEAEVRSQLTQLLNQKSAKTQEQ